MIKILFLDIDGVLNSEHYAMHRGARPSDCYTEDAWHIDPSSVQKLNRVISITDAKVVLSSDWRLAPAKPGVARTEIALRAQGASFCLFDSTPVLTEEQRLDRFGAEWKGSYTPRGFEIQVWLDRHPDVNVFAIVDDEPEMVHLSERLVLTDPAVGLMDKDCESLLRLLEQHHE